MKITQPGMKESENIYFENGIYIPTVIHRVFDKIRTDNRKILYVSF
jgi:hypothetical protein